MSGVYNIPRLLGRLQPNKKQRLARHVYGVPAFGCDEKSHADATPMTHIKHKLELKILVMNAQYVCTSLLVNLFLF